MNASSIPDSSAGQRANGRGSNGQGRIGQGVVELGGTGLGLPTVLGIVRQSGGFLEVASEVGVGTRMVVYLPRHAAAEADTVPSLPPVPAAPGGGGRVALVVEDEAAVRLVLARALTRAGWRVLAAETAELALEMLHGPAESPEFATIGCHLGRGHAGYGWAGAGAGGAPDLPWNPRGDGLRLCRAGAAAGLGVGRYRFSGKALRDG